jgi:hypothetical protein
MRHPTRESFKDVNRESAAGVDEGEEDGVTRNIMSIDDFDEVSEGSYP